MKLGAPRRVAVALVRLLTLLTGAALTAAPLSGQSPVRPNILWLTSEDNGPHLGAYGDAYADTPNLDRLAARGLTYLHVWSNAPVCAPARSTVITGLYPTATGSLHMRSLVRLPPELRMFPQLLREAGYYVTNNFKEDYNLEQPGQVWDESSPSAHWRNRPEGAPFFAVFNFLQTHESETRKRPHTPVHDPALAPVRAYLPDSPEVRRDRAQYYDKLTEMDRAVGERLAELEADGLADDTIVFYWGDHGAGFPREKRTPLDTGLAVPLIVSFPPKYRALAGADYAPGTRSERLVAFVDLAPTVLSLAGVEPPPYLQGGAFLGPFAAPPASHLFGFRGRMDERADSVRSVTDGRFVYARNYLPHLTYGQHVSYMFQTPTTESWYRLHLEGRLPPRQDFFWREKPSEELYDLESDPDQVRNLAASPEHRQTLERLRAALRTHLLAVRDVGLLPESEMHARAGGATPWQYGHGQAYPLERILATAELASDRARSTVADTADLRAALEDDDGAVRYWGAIGLQVRGAAAASAALAPLRAALGDPCPAARIAAAETVARYGAAEDRDRALAVLLERASLDRASLWEVLDALQAIDRLAPLPESVVAALSAVPRRLEGMPPLFANYVPDLLDHILGDAGP